MHIFVALSSPAVVALRGVSFAANCPFGCLGCRVSLETSGYREDNVAVKIVTDIKITLENGVGAKEIL